MIVSESSTSKQPLDESAVTFSVCEILICYCNFQIFKLSHIFKGFFFKPFVCCNFALNSVGMTGTNI